MPRLTAKEQKLLRDTHGGYGGRTLINRIESLMDKQAKRLRAKTLPMPDDLSAIDYGITQGRIDGLAAALAILRSSSVKEETSRSNDRIERLG
mgnify:CR=1 FL=1